MKATIELVNEDEIMQFARLFAGTDLAISTGFSGVSTPEPVTVDKAVEDVTASEGPGIDETGAEPETSDLDTDEPEAGEAPAPAVSKTDVLAATKKYVAANGAPALKKKLERFGLGNLGELQAERYGEFLAALETEDA